MSIALTVTWLSVQTPTTCVTVNVFSERQNQSDLGADGLEVGELVIEGLPLLGLQLRQPERMFTIQKTLFDPTCCP